MKAPSPDRERGWGGEGFAGFCLATLLACAPTPPPAPLPTQDAFEVDTLEPRGRYVDDYGEQYAFGVGAFMRFPYGVVHLEAGSAREGYMIAQNDSANRYDGGKWTRIDWVRLEGMPPWEWAYCLSAYNAPTADSTEATRIARPETPRTGCNGHPFTRLKRMVAPTEAMLEECRQLYQAAGSDGPKLLAVDSMIVDPVALPPLRCGHLRAQHPRVKDAE